MKTLDLCRLSVVIASAATALATRADHPSVALAGESGGPIIAPSASTLPTGTWAAALRLELLDLEEISDARLTALSSAHEHVHSVDRLWSASLSLAYGVTDDLDVGISLPYVERSDIREGEHHHGSPDTVARLGDSEGLGDARLHAKFRLAGASAGNRTSAILGATAPTGDSDRRTQSGELFDAHLQPGTDAWNPFIGLVHSRRLRQYSLHASLLYNWRREGTQNTDFGDSLYYNFALAVPLFAHDHTAHHHDQEPNYLSSLFAHGRWDFVLELNGEWHDKDETSDVEDDHTGGNIIYLAPGLRARLTPTTSVAFSVGVPVVENLNGVQSEPEARIVGALGISF